MRNEITNPDAASAMDAWSRLCVNVDGLGSLPSLESLLARETSLATTVEMNKPAESIDPEQEAYFCLVRLLGADLELAADLSGIPDQKAHELEAQASVLALTTHLSLTGKDSRAVLLAATTGEGRRMINRLFAIRAGSTKLMSAVAVFDERVVAEVTSLGDIVLACKDCLNLLPDGFTVAVLPEKGQEVADLAARLAAIGRNVQVKKASALAGTGFRFTVIPSDGPSHGPRTQGIHTRIFRAALAATLFITSRSKP